jgi:hypothetical protein
VVVLGTLAALAGAADVRAQDLRFVTEVKVTSQAASPFTLTRQVTFRAKRERFASLPSQPSRIDSLRGGVEEVDRQMSEAGFTYAGTRERNGKTMRVYQRDEKVGSATYVVQFRARSRLRSRGEGAAVQMEIAHTGIDVQNVRFIKDYPAERRDADLAGARQRVLEEVARLERQVKGALYDLSAAQARAIREPPKAITFGKGIPLALPNGPRRDIVVTISAVPTRRTLDGALGGPDR